MEMSQNKNYVYYYMNCYITSSPKIIIIVLHCYKLLSLLLLLL